MSNRPFLKYPLAALTAILMLYVALTILAMLGSSTLDWQSVRKDMWSARITILIFGCVIAGVLRVSSFHPRFAKSYGGWLSATPWRSGLRLPLGPVSLVWEDLLLVVPLGILATMDADIPAWVPIASFLLGYCALAVAGLRTNAAVWFWYMLLFLASLPVLWHNQLDVLIVVLFIALIVAHLALALSLKNFPWDLGDTMRESKRHPRAGLSWPLDRVGPAAPVQPIRPAVGFAGAILCGWWVFVLLKVISEVDSQLVVQSILVMNDLPEFCAAAALYRFFRYCFPYWPPLSLRGRLLTGRFIIPGYDYVLISPLLMCVIGYAFPRLLGTHLPWPVVGGLTTACVAAVGLNGGPTLPSWQLTGHHRLVATTRREPPVPRARAVRKW